MQSEPVADGFGQDHPTRFIHLECHTISRWHMASTLASRFNMAGVSLLPLSVKDRPRPRTAMLAVVEHDLPIHQQILDAGCVLVRILIGGAVDDLAGVENGDVRPLARPKQAAVE